MADASAEFSHFIGKGALRKPSEKERTAILRWGSVAIKGDAVHVFVSGVAYLINHGIREIKKSADTANDLRLISIGGGKIEPVVKFL